MSKPKLFYRIKNVETNRYYTGKIYYINNPKYDSKYQSKYNTWSPEDTIKRSELEKYLKFYYLDQNNRYREISSYNKKIDFTAADLPPWIRYRGCYWSDEGKLYDTKKGAELVMSHLTKTSKKLRSNKVDFILNAPPEASKFKLIACKFEVTDISSEDEAKILQSSKASEQAVNE